MDRVSWLKEAIPGIALSTDIIVGFPGEGEIDYNYSKEMLLHVEFDYIYLFKYSRRPGTSAADIEGEVPQDVMGTRFCELLELQKGVTLNKSRAMEGRIERILVEGPSKTDASKRTGRTVSNKIVNFPGSAEQPGEEVAVKITRGGLYSLDGVKT